MACCDLPVIPSEPPATPPETSPEPSSHQAAFKLVSGAHEVLGNDAQRHRAAAALQPTFGGRAFWGARPILEASPSATPIPKPCFTTLYRLLHLSMLRGCAVCFPLRCQISTHSACMSISTCAPSSLITVTHQ